MKPLSRRSVTTGLAAAVTAIPSLVLAEHAGASPLNRIRAALDQIESAFGDLPPITPAEYLAEMEANGWRPIAPTHRNGRAESVVEYTVNEYPTHRDMEFLRYMNVRCAKSGTDFYKRAAQYLVDHGRTVPWTELMACKPSYRPMTSGLLT